MTRYVGVRLGVPILLAALLFPLPGSAAWAHGDEGAERAFTLVRQAIALIVNAPDHHDPIMDKVDDALASDDKSDVDIALVQQAKDALDAEDMHRARALLEQSIGARVHTSSADPVPIGDHPPVTGEDTGTLVAVDGIPGRAGLSTGDWVLVAVSAGIALLGVVLAFAMRPRSTHADPAVTS